MAFYRLFPLPPVIGKLLYFTAGKRSVNGKSINPIFARKFLLKRVKFSVKVVKIRISNQNWPKSLFMHFLSISFLVLPKF